MITTQLSGEVSTSLPGPVRIPTTGIPQSTANPMFSELTRPADEAERKRRAEYLARLDQAALDPEAFFKANPLDDRFLMDPETEKREVVVSAFLRYHNNGQRIPVGSFGEDLLRRDLAFRLFDGRGADSREAFHAEIVKDATRRRDAKALAGELMAAAFEDAMLPSDQARGFAPLREKLRAHPGYDPAMEADYLDTWTETRRQAAERVDAYREPLVAVWRAFKADGNITAAAFDAWQKLPEDRRGDFLETLAIRAKALPVEEQARFFQNMRKVTTRTVADFGRQGGEELLSAAAMQNAEADPMGVRTLDTATGFRPELQAQRVFARKVREVFREDFDPIRSAFGAGKPGFWEGVAYQVPGVAGTSMTMAVPLVGPSFMAASMKGAAFDDVSARLEAGGMSEAAAADTADALSGFIAAPQAALEKVSFGLWARKLPAFSAALDAMGDRISNRVLRGAVKTVAIGTAETAVETLQDATTFAVQDVAAGLAADVPGVRWTGEGGALDGLWAQAPETFAVMLPLAILGAAGGLSRESQAAAWAASTPLQRRALGISDAASAAIDAAATRGRSSLVSAVESAWASRDPNSASAQAAVQELRTRQQTMEQAANTLRASGELPVMVRSADGWSVQDGATGEEVGTSPDLSGAWRIAQAHSDFLADMKGDAVAYMATLLESADFVAEMDPATTTRLELGTVMTQAMAEAENPATAARFAAQAALKEQAAGGDGSISYGINGMSETEIRGELRNTVNRIFQGGSVLTVFHEFTHGKRREARAAGRITRADEIAFLRALDTVLADRKTRDGEALRFIPEGMADDAVDETLIDEAMSEVMEMEILRSRSGGGKRKAPARKSVLGVPSGFVTRNLSAIARLAPEATRKLSAFIEAARAHFGQAMARALVLKKAEREGKFDAAGYDAFLNKLLGTDAQQEFDNLSSAEFQRVFQLPDEVADDDIPFSLGRASAVLSKDSKVFPGADGSPSVVGPAAFSIRAFHGTPHKVDKFTTEKIGTGEGAQVYGWGLYFAESLDVAKGYRSKLSKQYGAAIDGVPAKNIDPTTWEVADDILSLGGNIDAYIAQQQLRRNAQIKKNLEEKRDDRAAIIKDALAEEIAIAESLRGKSIETYSGNLYRVNLKVNDEDLLDWDKPLTQQPRKALASFRYMQKKLADAITARRQRMGNPSLDALEDKPFSGWYGNMVEMLGGEREASRYLFDIGIRGIRYLDGNSRGEGAGSYNYVIFDDADIEIVEENGKPVDMAAPAFSLTPSRGLELMRMDALKRISNPRRRAETFRRISKEFERLKLTAERLELTAGTKRMRKSLAKEAAMREAIRAEELEREAYARHFGILSNDDLVKIKAQPAHAMLADKFSPLRGRLMSKAAWLKKHADSLWDTAKAGDYDGADGLSRSVFGGELTPDKAALELYQAGLIRENTVDALWDILHAEQAFVAKMKEAKAGAMEAIREARMQAKAETNAWLATQTETQSENYSPKQEVLRALASLDAILSALPPAIRGKIGGYTQIARLGSEETRLEYLREKIAKADKELERWLREELDAEFRALLARTKPERDEAGRRPKGKIGASVHDLFRTLEDAMFLDGAETESLASALEATAEGESTTEEQAAHLALEANLVRLVGNWRKADAARREAALEEATKAYYGGYMEAQVKAAAKRARITQARQALRADTGKAGDRMERVERAVKDNGTKLGRARDWLLSLFSFDQVLALVFGEGSETANLLRDWELRASNAKEDAIQRANEELEDLLATLAGGSYKGEQLRWKLADETRRDVKVTDALGKVQELTQLESISWTLMWDQEDGRRHMEGAVDEDGNRVSSWGYTEENRADIERQLSPEAKALRLHLQESYAAEYDRINAVFSDLYGVNMPRHKNYAPITVAPQQAPGGQVMDPVSGGMIGPGLTPGSLKNRSHTAVAEPRFPDALQTFIAHTRQMEHFIAYAPFAAEAMAALNQRDVQNSIEAKAGKEAAQVLRAWIDYFAQGGTREATAHLAMNGWIRRGLDRVMQATLVGRVSVLAMQSLQLMAASLQMPVSAYLPRLAKLMSGQLAWGDALRSDYIQRRLKQMPPAVQQAMQGLSAGRPSRIKFLVAQLGRSISGADALFTAGTYAMIYDHQLMLARERGLPDPESIARRETERLVDQVAQPTRAGARSLFEVTQTYPAARMLFAFASEPRQKLALTAWRIAHREGSERWKPAVLLVLMGGIMPTLLRTVLRDIRDDGEDEEVFDARNWDPSRFALMALTGPLGGFPLIGKELESAIYSAAGEYQPGGTVLGSVKDAAGAAGRVATGNVTWETAIADLEKIASGLAPVSGDVAAASSILHVLRDLESIWKNVTD